ncbi:oligosaccharide flippase family protein, partial [Myxococcota bacterium]|nr:oligosaccharide flippase family protein [Myxococcota bacterium]
MSEANSSKNGEIPALRRYDLASGALWNMGGFGLGQFLRLLSNVILTRLLLQEAFGIMALTMVMISSVATLSDLGIRASVVQNPDAEDRSFLDTAWTMNIVRAVILFIVVCGVAFPFADFYETPEIKYLVPMVGLRILIDAATTTKLVVYRRHVKIKQLALIDVSGQIAGLVIMVPLAWYFEAVWTLVVAGLVQSSFRTIMSYMLPGENNRLCWHRSSVRKIYHFGRWILLGTALNFADTAADRLVFGKLVSLAMLGVYNIGGMMAGIAGRIVGRLSTSLFFPVLSRVHEENGQIAEEYNL